MSEAAAAAPASAEAKDTSAQAGGQQAGAKPTGEAKGGEQLELGILGDVGEGKDGEGEEGAKPEGEASQDAPFEVKLPEGLEVDASTLEWFTGRAKELGLTSEQASALVTENAQRAEAAAKEASELWLKEIREDKEFGGDKFDATTQAARNALRRFGGEEFAKLMNETGMANHPDMVKTFARIGAAMKEDSSDTGGRAGSGAPKSDYERLKQAYPNSPELWDKG